MSRTKSSHPIHTGLTGSGNIRDVKIERIGNVTIYKRGTTYFLYYRENARTMRPKIEGNLAVARATAARVSTVMLQVCRRICCKNSLPLPLMAAAMTGVLPRSAWG